MRTLLMMAAVLAGAPAWGAGLTLESAGVPAVDDDWTPGAAVVTEVRQGREAAVPTTPAIAAGVEGAGESPWLWRVVERLANRVDAGAISHPAMAAGVLRVSPVGDRLRPFAALALDQPLRPVEENRLGMGGGAQLRIGSRGSLGAEVLVFPREEERREVRMVTRLEVRF